MQITLRKIDSKFKYVPTYFFIEITKHDYFNYNLNRSVNLGYVLAFEEEVPSTTVISCIS